MAYPDISPSGGDTGCPLNLAKRLAIIERFGRVRGSKVIDCGCGTGQYTDALFRAGADIYGVEYDGDKVAKCLSHHPELNGRVTKQSIEAIEFPDNSFDVAILNEVLEHVSNHDKALEQVYRVLKHEGLLFVFSPNRLYPFETHSVYLKRSNRRLPIYVPFVPYVPLFLGRSLFTYVARNYWPRQLRRMLQDKGFVIVSAGYVWQTFENISGDQPRVVSALRPFLRRTFGILERVPLVNAFGVSQAIVARKALIAPREM